MAHLLERTHAPTEKARLARQALAESLDAFDRSFSKLNLCRDRLRLVHRNELKLTRWQFEFIDALKGFYNAMYEAIGAFALFLNHFNRGLFADEKKKTWSEAGGLLNLLLRKDFDAKAELEFIMEAYSFRAFIAHPQQHRAHDWLTCAWPGETGPEAMVVWFTRTGDFVYFVQEMDPYSPDYIPAVDHDSFKVPPKPWKVHRAIYRAVIKVLSKAVLAENAELAGEEFPLSQPHHETQSYIYALIGARLGEQALKTSEPERTKLYEKAVEKFDLALNVWPYNYQALNNFGWMIFEESLTLDYGDERFGHLAASIERLQASVAMKPDYLHALTNLGEVLLEEARYRLDPEPALDHAEKVFKRLASCCPGCVPAECGLAWIASMRSAQAEGAEADRLFQESERRYRQALAREPDSAMVSGQLAVALARRGENTEGDIGRKALVAACSLFEQTWKIDPEDLNVLRNWALALEKLAERGDAEEAAQLRQLAAGKRALFEERRAERQQAW